MQLSALVASVLLLAIPALVSAAPTTPADANNALVPRAPTCDAPKPDKNDAAAVKKYNDLMAKMSAATKAAHDGETACKSSSSTDFSKSKDKTKRTQIKKTCVDGYQKCVTNRKTANNACKSLGGTVDAGHLQAVQVCQTQLTTWQGKTP